MQRIRAGLSAGLLILLAVPVASADVTVRAEGVGGTVVRTAVSRIGPAVTKAGATCAGDSAAGALDRAVGGDWDADNFGGSDPLFVSRIHAETLTFTPPEEKYWAFHHNNVFSTAGICGHRPQDGDELQFFAACGSATATNCFEGNPLDVAAPATATARTPFTVSVRQFDESKDPAVPSHAAGATVAGGGQTAVTGTDGSAQLTLTQTGHVVLTVTKGKQPRDEATVEVVAEPVYAIPTPAPSAAPEADSAAPESRIRRIAEGQRFRRRRAPRVLRATVTDASALRAVRIALTRRRGGRCTAFDGQRDRFRRVRCGRHPRLEVGTAKRVSFLLPRRLGPGRYVYDVVATDSSGNRETLARGRNRVVFHVR